MTTSFVVVDLGLLGLLGRGEPEPGVLAFQALWASVGVGLLVSGRVALGAGLLASFVALTVLDFATTTEVTSLGVAFLLVLVSLQVSLGWARSFWARDVPDGNIVSGKPLQFGNYPLTGTHIGGFFLQPY